MLSDELITKIGADLEQLPLEPTSRRELDLLVCRLAGNIRAAQERGATYVEIAKQISASGYPIKRSTLCAALMRQRKNAATAKRPVRSDTARSKPTPPPSRTAAVRGAGERLSENRPAREPEGTGRAQAARPSHRTTSL
jgi:hypothetical protein